MARDIIEDILTVLVIISFLVAIFMFFWKIFGNSPTIQDLIIALVAGLLFYMFKIEYSRGKFAGKFESFLNNTKQGFNRVREDIHNFRREMNYELSHIKKEISKSK